MIVDYDEFFKKIEEDNGLGVGKVILADMLQKIKGDSWFRPSQVDLLQARIPYFVYANGAVVPIFMDPLVATSPLGYFEEGGPAIEFYAYPLSDFVLRYGC